MTDTKQQDMPDDIWLITSEMGRYHVVNNLYGAGSVKYIRADLSRPAPSDAARKEALEDVSQALGILRPASDTQGAIPGGGIRCTIHPTRLKTAIAGVENAIAYLSAPSPMTVPDKVRAVLNDWEAWAQSASQDERNPDLLHALKDFREAILDQQAAPDPIETCARRNKEIEHVTLAALREKVEGMKRSGAGAQCIETQDKAVVHNAALSAVIAEIDAMMKEEKVHDRQK